jgi:hypothetical protein
MKKRTRSRKMQTNGKAEQAAVRPRLPAPAPEQIQRRAYELYEARGREAGHELDDWLLAEYELKAEIGLPRHSPAD